MLQRQQASAIIDARKMIVDGAVGMVEMALDQLSEKEVVELDESMHFRCEIQISDHFTSTHLGTCFN